MKKPLSPGKWAEAEVQAWLEKASASSSPDARAARGALAAQPADYLVSFQSKPIHLEIKETENAGRLPRSKIRQYGVLKKWWWAGIEPYVLVWCSTLGMWYVLRAADLYPNQDTTPTSFRFDNQARFYNDLNTAMEYIVS
jgi:hypothetical protein